MERGTERNWCAWAELSLESCGRDDGCFQKVLGEVLEIQGDEEVRFALIGTKTKWVIFGIGRNPRCRTKFEKFGALPNQIDDTADMIWMDAKPLENSLVFLQNVF